MDILWHVPSSSIAYHAHYRVSHFSLVSSKQVSHTVAHGAALDDLPGSTKPLKSFDPLGLSELGSDETFAWFRAAELKHSRAAMVATTGFLIQAAGVHFPGMLSKDISFESLSGLNPVDQWEAVPDAGKLLLVACVVLNLEFRETV
jgi:hypothetical protein